MIINIETDLSVWREGEIMVILPDRMLYWILRSFHIFIKGTATGSV